MANGTITIDSYECITRLMRAKFSKAQAEAVKRVLEKDANIDTTELATKKDLALLEQRMTVKFLFMLIGLFIAIIGADKILG